MIPRVLLCTLCAFVTNGLIEGLLHDPVSRTIAVSISAMVYGTYLLIYGMTQG